MKHIHSPTWLNYDQSKHKQRNVSSQLELRPMIQAGVAGFKCFLIHSGVEEFPHVTDRDLHTAMRQLQGTGSVLLVSQGLQCLP